MTRPQRELGRVRQALPGAACDVRLTEGAPGRRGELGQVTVRTPDGNGRRAWWLRCPWCRSIIEVSPANVRVVDGVVHLRGQVGCSHCEAGFTVRGGVAARLAGSVRVWKGGPR